jgi:hypothetical protein
MWSAHSAAACAAWLLTLTATWCGAGTKPAAWRCSGVWAGAERACGWGGLSGWPMNSSHAAANARTCCLLLCTSHRYLEAAGRLECTATILPGRAGAGLKQRSAAALLDVKPRCAWLGGAGAHTLGSVCCCCCCCAMRVLNSLTACQPLRPARVHTSACCRSVNRRSMSCRGRSAAADEGGSAEGPIRAMLVRDDRAWVSGGRTDPWIALFDAVLGA